MMKLSEKYTAVKRVAILFFLIVLATGTAYSQDPGGSPDGPPPAVPFDDYLHLFPILAGLMLTFFVIRRMQKKGARQV